MRAIDASSIIYAWDNYPQIQFPRLWEWIGEICENGSLVIPQVAFDQEVKRKSPDCAQWLLEYEVRKIAESNEILAEALRIKRILGIRNDQYHAKGVGENDVLIIATCKIEGLELVSNESRQIRNPQSNDRLKIPAVCDLPEVGVPCIDFLELIRSSGKVF